MKPFLAAALLCSLFGVASADDEQHVPQLLDDPAAGFEIEAEWKAPRTWSPRAMLPVYMKNASFRDVLVVTHLHGDVAWGAPQRCDAVALVGDTVTFSCPALDGNMTQQTGPKAMALTYRRLDQDQQEKRDFVTVLYTVTRFARE